MASDITEELFEGVFIGCSVMRRRRGFDELGGHTDCTVPITAGKDRLAIYSTRNT